MAENSSYKISRRDLLRSTLAFTATLGVVGTPVARWLNELNKAYPYREQIVSDFEELAQTRRQLLEAGGEPVIFSPEHNFTHEDFRKLFNITSIIMPAEGEVTIPGLGGTGFVTYDKGGHLCIGTAQHVLDAFIDHTYTGFTLFFPQTQEVITISKDDSHISRNGHKGKDIGAIVTNITDVHKPRVKITENHDFSSDVHYFILGYPGALRRIGGYVPHQDVPDFVSKYALYTQYVTAKKDILDPSLVRHNRALGAPGLSGSPVVFKNPNTQELEIVGVVSEGDEGVETKTACYFDCNGIPVTVSNFFAGGFSEYLDNLAGHG